MMLAARNRSDGSPVSCSFHHLDSKLRQRLSAVIIKFRRHCLEYAEHCNVVRLS